MEDIEQDFCEIKNGIRQGVRDHSLISALRAKTDEIRLNG